MPIGTINSIRDRDFGFIKPSDGDEDLFFHNASVLNGGFEQLREGQQVSFGPEPDSRDPKRQRAIRVAVINGTQDERRNHQNNGPARMRAGPLFWSSVSLQRQRCA